MQMAIQAVGAHRFRSLLTVLGIVIGITTVVTVASLLTGLREGVVVFFRELGPELRIQPLRKDVPGGQRDRPPQARRQSRNTRRWCALGHFRADIGCSSTFRRWMASRSPPTFPVSNRRISTWPDNRPTWARSRRAISTPAATSHPRKTSAPPTSPSSAPTSQTRCIPAAVRSAALS